MNKFISGTIYSAVITLLLGSQVIAAPQNVLRTPQSIQPYQVKQQPIVAMPSLQPGAPVVTYHDPSIVIVYTPQMFEVTSSYPGSALSGNNRINLNVSWKSPNPQCQNQMWTAATEVKVFVGPLESAVGPVDGDPTGGATLAGYIVLGPPARLYCSFTNKSQTFDVINQNDVLRLCSTAVKGANLLAKQKVLTYISNRFMEGVVFDVLVHCPK
ncbi:MAG: hypothetical protein Q7W05_14280 [Deltaproteobacteria bacterium]|nr:hypothetical protein [Deltaproteobacteria bacterium]